MNGDAQNRYQELTSFGVVEINLNGEDVKFDISGECERYSVGTDVHVFAKITNEQARLISESESFGVQIKFVHDSPTFLCISAMSTDGGVEQLSTKYQELENSLGPLRTLKDSLVSQNKFAKAAVQSELLSNLAHYTFFPRGVSGIFGSGQKKTVEFRKR